MIDLHCHILPGIDDGPPDLDAALDLARAQSAVGVKQVIATPHVTWDHPHNDSEAIAAATAALNGKLESAGIDIEVLTGAEVAITRAAELDDDELNALTLGGGPWLLVESPLTPGATGFDAILSHLQMRGHRLVLAHPERAPAFQRDVDLLERLVHGGMLTSLTASALTDRFGTTAGRFARDLVRRGLVHNVASDAHDATRRAPGIREHLDAAGLGDRADWLAEAVPAAIVGGDPLPAPPAVAPPPPERRSLRRLLGR